MATKQTIARPVGIPVDVTAGRRPRLGKGSLLWAVALAGAVAVAAGFYVTTNDQIEHLSVPPIHTHDMTREEIMSDLVNRGLIPSQSLEPARPTRDEIMRDLVNRGLIPAKSLEPRQLTRDEIMRDLVNRGLIPRQSLDD